MESSCRAISVDSRERECNQFFSYNCSLELSTCFQGQEEAVIKIIKRILSQRHSVVIGMGKIGAIKRVMHCL